MANTFFGLNIGVSGLYAANAGVDVTANNVANENTKGYSRQVISQSATEPIRVFQRYGMIGSGVEVTSIDQMRDKYYDAKYWDNNSKLGEESAKYNYMIQIEDYFAETDETGFSKEYSNIFNGLEDLVKTPEGNTERVTFLNYCESFLEYMQELKTNLIKSQEDLNSEVASNVDHINSLGAEIAALNKEINVVELTGAKANELRDKRALLLDELSSICEISTKEVLYDNGKSDFTVNIGDKTLVSTYDYYTLEVVSREDRADKHDAVGLYDIQWSYGEKFDPVGSNIDGALRSLLIIRDGNNYVPEEGNDISVPIDYKGVPYYIDEINEFLTKFTGAFNEIHSKGMNMEGESTKDIPIFLKDDNDVFTVNQDLMANPSWMSTTVNVHDGAAQYDLLSEMIKVKDSKEFDGGSPEEFIQSLITEIAIDTSKAKTLNENYKNIIQTITNQREAVMGVDADEEAMNLVKYQEAYDLSAKVIQVMSEMYDKLINETGV
ncbi:MAG: flagellar hook-associated protein FlgK [Lachnospiraceae bacterium]|nr:flagellar hook-associated protein FlgK [Lachnospiraceae bacterium]